MENRLLIEERPLIVLPSLVMVLNGNVNKALLLQQLHWHLGGNYAVVERDGARWLRHSAKQWQKEFPWLSTDSIERLLKDLEDAGLVHSAVDNNWAADRSKSYTLDYAALSQSIREIAAPIREIAAPISYLTGLQSVNLTDAIDIKSTIKNSTPRGNNGTTPSRKSTPHPPLSSKKRNPVSRQSLLDPEEERLVQERLRIVAAMVEALAEVMVRDLTANARQLTPCAELLVDRNVSPSDVRKWYGAGGWWYTEDWRGKKGNYPNVAAIRETFLLAGKTGGKGHEAVTLQDLR